MLVPWGEERGASFAKAQSSQFSKSLSSHQTLTHTHIYRERFAKNLEHAYHPLLALDVDDDDVDGGGASVATHPRHLCGDGSGTSG